jgi:hypothetical protein
MFEARGHGPRCHDFWNAVGAAAARQSLASGRAGVLEDDHIVDDLGGGFPFKRWAAGMTLSSWRREEFPHVLWAGTRIACRSWLRLSGSGLRVLGWGREEFPHVLRTGARTLGGSSDAVPFIAPHAGSGLDGRTIHNQLRDRTMPDPD